VSAWVWLRLAAWRHGRRGQPRSCWSGVAAFKTAGVAAGGYWSFCAPTTGYAGLSLSLAWYRTANGGANPNSVGLCTAAWGNPCHPTPPTAPRAKVRCPSADLSTGLNERLELFTTPLPAAAANNNMTCALVVANAAGAARNESFDDVVLAATACWPGYAFVGGQCVLCTAGSYCSGGAVATAVSLPLPSGRLERSWRRHHADRLYSSPRRILRQCWGCQLVCRVYSVYHGSYALAASGATGCSWTARTARTAMLPALAPRRRAPRVLDWAPTLPSTQRPPAPASRHGLSSRSRTPACLQHARLLRARRAEQRRACGRSWLIRARHLSRWRRTPTGRWGASPPPTVSQQVRTPVWPLVRRAALHAPQAHTAH
jgi:hypothetical protein